MSKSENITEIFKVKIGLSPELMNDIFEFIEKLSSLRINWQFWPENPNEKIRHRNIENMIKDFFPNEYKAIIYLVDFKAKMKT